MIAVDWLREQKLEELALMREACAGHHSSLLVSATIECYHAKPLVSVSATDDTRLTVQTDDAVRGRRNIHDTTFSRLQLQGNKRLIS